MAHAYTPGLKVSRHLRHRVRRILPISGDVLVGVGDRVNARDVVAQTFMPGEVTPINLANMLSIPPGDVPGCLLKKEDDRVEVGDLLAQTPGIFGLFKNSYKSKVAGEIETVSAVTGQLIIRGEPLPVQVRAYMTGEVVEVIEKEGVVIEADVSYIQGIFGIGGEIFGPIRIAGGSASDTLTVEQISEEMQGAVVIGGARMTGDAVRKAIDVGAAAIVSGGMDDADLRDILGYDLGVAITGSEDVGITLVVTEGFGDIAMAERTFQLLKEREGHDASVNGATQIRAGVMRPEVVIPLTESESAQGAESPRAAGLLDVGMPVRVIRDPYFGQIGEVTSLPAEPKMLESESKARVLAVRFSTGEEVTVPRANVELIEE